LLLRRGYDPGSISAAKAALALVGAPITPQDAVEYSFTRHGSPSAFGRGRFGDGSGPVFYAALEEETCVAEVRHHIKDEIIAVPSPRFFQLIACDFSGTVLVLIGKEADHPDLVSQTEAGYPFCQALGLSARASKIDAFHTTSARRNGGICSPVFSRPALANPRSISSVVFVTDSGGLKYERLSK
jgi:hypothetical protein